MPTPADGTWTEDTHHKPRDVIVGAYAARLSWLFDEEGGGWNERLLEATRITGEPTTGYYYLYDWLSGLAAAIQSFKGSPRAEPYEDCALSAINFMLSSATRVPDGETLWETKGRGRGGVWLHELRAALGALMIAEQLPADQEPVQRIVRMIADELVPRWKRENDGFLGWCADSAGMWTDKLSLWMLVNLYLARLDDARHMLNLTRLKRTNLLHALGYYLHLTDEALPQLHFADRRGMTNRGGNRLYGWAKWPND